MTSGFGNNNGGLALVLWGKLALRLGLEKEFGLKAGLVKGFRWG